MGKIRFGNTSESLPVKPFTWPPELLDISEQDLSIAYTVDSTPMEAPLATMLPSAIQYQEVEKIVYIDKPVEVVKEVKVIEYVEKEVIVEKPVEVIKTIEVVKYVDKEVIIEKPVTVEIVRELEVPNKLNKYMVAIIAALMAIIILQGLL
jgi:hypothetical protein